MCSTRRLMYKILLSLLFILIAFPAKAELEITIYMMRSNTDATTATTTYDYVDSYQISSTNSTDFVQAVNTVTGLSLVQSGPTGQNVSLFMRGGDSNHTLVTMNGLPIGDASTTNGLHDFGNNFMGTISAIEIIKNPSGALVGPNSIGGVVNFVTGPVYENSLTVGYGSNNTKKFNAKTNTIIDNTSVGIMIDGKASDGISVMPTGTEADGYNANSISVNTLTILENNARIKANIMLNRNNSDLDTTQDDLDYTAHNNSNIYQMHYDHNNTSVAYGYSEYDRTYTNGTERDEYDSARHNILATHTFVLDTMDLVPGIEYEHKSAEFNNRGSYNSSVDAWEYNTALFLNSNWRASDDLIISSGIRQDTLEDYDDYTTLRFGGAYTVNHNLKLRSNWSNSVRTPTLYEKYGADNYGYRGNSTLDVERGETVDLGVTLGALDVVYYTTDINNTITYANSSYTNVTGTSTRQGVEANYNYALTDEWTHNLGAHWSDAQDANNTTLLRRPKWTLSQTLAKTTDTYSTTVVHNYRGEHVDLDASTYARKDMSAVNTVDVHHQVGAVTASVRNILDEQYEQPDGYNQSGRTFEISYKISF